jgi:malonyl CoA-acyl carrier protein transacylase
VVIEQRIPMHASIFRPVVELLGPALERAPWRSPQRRYLPNVLARFELDPTPERFVELLSRHAYQSVLWRDSIDYLTNLYPDIAFVEVGPRAVLFNLLSRKWLSCPRYKTDAVDGSGAFDAVVRELARGAA